MAGVDMGMEQAADEIKQAIILEPVITELGVALSAITMNCEGLISATTAATSSGTDKGIELTKTNFLTPT